MSTFHLTNENYHSLEANRLYFSASQIKRFLECEAVAMAELDGTYAREKGTALLVGGYVDAHFSHELDLFCAQNPEIYTNKGTLRAEYSNANDIIARIERDPLAVRMLDGDVQRIETGLIGSGYPFRVKLDCWLSAEKAQAIARDYPEMDDLLFAAGAIVDLKIMKDFAPLYRDGQGRLTFIEYWRYDLQLAIYQEIMRQRTGERVPCYILGATKEKTTDIGLYQVPQELMDMSMEMMLEQMPRIVALKLHTQSPERCEACDYCKQTKVLTCASWLEDWA